MSLADRAGLTRQAIPTAYPTQIDDRTMQRFFAKVRVPALALLTTACWRWQGTLNDRGYGKFHVSLAPRAARGSGRGPRRELFAHRLMLVVTTGRDGEGLEADHIRSCGPDACVSPFHLRWTEWQDNMDARNDAQGWVRQVKIDPLPPLPDTAETPDIPY